MKFVMTKAEVAEALALTLEEFSVLQEDLQRRGFPKPIAGLGERWSIMDVMNWVNRSPGSTFEPTVVAGKIAPFRH